MWLRNTISILPENCNLQAMAYVRCHIHAVKLFEKARSSPLPPLKGLTDGP